MYLFKCQWRDNAYKITTYTQPNDSKNNKKQGNLWITYV